MNLRRETPFSELPYEEQKRLYEEQKRRGEAIYEAKIRHLIGPEDAQKWVKIDVLSGDYEIHENRSTAGLNLRERRPDAVIHTMRRHETYVGHWHSMRRIPKGKVAQ